MRDSSGAATWAIVYSMQQNNNEFQRSTQIWGFRKEDSLNLKGRKFDC